MSQLRVPCIDCWLLWRCSLWKWRGALLLTSFLQLVQASSWQLVLLWLAISSTYTCYSGRSLYTLYTHSVRVKVVIEISLFGFIFWYIRFLMPEYAWICGNSCIMIFFFHIRILSVLQRLGLLYCPNWKCIAHSSPHFPVGHWLLAPLQRKCKIRLASFT